MGCAAGQEVLCEWRVKEFGLMGNNIVKDGNHLAVFLQPPCYPSQGRGEPRHPVTDYDQIRVPVPYRLVGLDISEWIRRIQESLALYGYGVIILSYVLGLSRKEEIRVLPLEIERFDRVLLSQFQV